MHQNYLESYLNEAVGRLDLITETIRRKKETE